MTNKGVYKMKAKITKSELFDIEINGFTHKGFTKVDTWSGLAKYKNKDGEVIATDSFVDGLFNWMLAPHKGIVNTDETFSIIMASPFFQANGSINGSYGQPGGDAK